MAFTSFPFESTDTDESQYTQLFREFAGTGVVDSQLGGDLLVTGSGSALQVSIAAGDAIVRGFMTINDGPVAMTINPNSSGSTRVDRIVLKLDPAANSIAPVYKVGTASPPSLTQTDTGVYEMPLAKVTVANGATNLSGAVIDERPFVDMRLGCWATAHPAGHDELRQYAATRPGRVQRDLGPLGVLERLGVDRPGPARDGGVELDLADRHRLPARGGHQHAQLADADHHLDQADRVRG